MGVFDDFLDDLSKYRDQWYECLKDDYYTAARLAILIVVTILMIWYIVKLDFKTFDDEPEATNFQSQKSGQKQED